MGERSRIGLVGRIPREEVVRIDRGGEDSGGVMLYTHRRCVILERREDLVL